MTTIEVTLHEEDPEELDEQIRLLRDDLSELDVEISAPECPPAPEDAKGMDPQTLSTIIVAVSSSPVLIQLGRVLAAFVERGKQKITLKEGDRSAEILGPHDDNTRQVIESFCRPKEIE